MKHLMRVVMVSVALTGGLAYAQQAPSPAHPGGAAGGMAIPQAAFDVCKGKAAGAAVTWKSMHGNTLVGSCRAFGGSMVAVPNSMATHRPAGMAPAAGPAAAMSGAGMPAGDMGAGIGQSMMTRPLSVPGK